ncbi:hypothetical protein POTOM_028334 [Populus tomentosa]|uniref:S-adenosyl-L-methionine-dependent methyltransferases superfamily protein n=1 Tax=Populus tomentosa TaxID=118781 RepID=A0A8X8CUK6_POPTO|nr:hypothetical protein POTOM_028334 [Populus tomentosa]
MNCLSRRLILKPPLHSNLTLNFPSINVLFYSKPISIHQKRKLSANTAITSLMQYPLSGAEEDLVGYVFGKKKATEVAHLIWKRVVQNGDTVIDATCGNGYDTLAMLKMVADELGRGRVYGMDIQGDALKSTSSLLDESVTLKEKALNLLFEEVILIIYTLVVLPETQCVQKELVKLFSICHSRMEEIVPENSPVRLVAFNLGYLPGGDKTITTVSETTQLALEAAKKILIPGGLISLVVYVGHPGGMEELETVEAFASGLSVDNWICCKFQMLNRPLAPVLVLLFKRGS